MGLIDSFLSFIRPSNRTAIQIHRVHTGTPDGERQAVTYVTGEIIERPTVVASTGDLQIPSDVVLIEHDDKEKYMDINGRPYPVYEYTSHHPSEVPDDVTAEPLPEDLRGASIQKQEMNTEDWDTILKALP